MKLKKAYTRFVDSNAHDMGAALAYFTIFSMVPLLVVIISTVGIVFGKELIQGKIFYALQDSLGTDSVLFLKTTLENAHTDTGVFGNIIGGVTLVASVIALTGQLQSSLDRIFGYVIKPIGIIRLIREKLASFMIVLLLGVFIILIMSLSAGITFFEEFFRTYITFPIFYVQIVNLLISSISIFGFSVINFRFLPHILLSWKSIFTGSSVTTIGFMIGKFALGIYLGFAQPGSAYGAAGALIVLLVWIYYSSQILFFGASVAYANEHSV